MARLATVNVRVIPPQPVHLGAALEAAMESAQRASQAAGAGEGLAATEQVIRSLRSYYLPGQTPANQTHDGFSLLVGALALEADAHSRLGVQRAVAGCRDVDALRALLTRLHDLIEASVKASAAVQWDLAVRGAPARGSVVILESATAELLAFVAGLR